MKEEYVLCYEFTKIFGDGLTFFKLFNEIKQHVYDHVNSLNENNEYGVKV